MFPRYRRIRIRTASRENSGYPGTSDLESGRRKSLPARLGKTRTTRGKETMGYEGRTVVRTAAQRRRQTAYMKRWRAIPRNHRAQLKCCANYRKANRNKITRTKNAWRARQPRYKVAAWNAVQRALKKGTLIRPKKCSKCGKRCKPHAHHDDYRKPLEVRWLCFKPCHLAETKKEKGWQ